MCRPLERCRIWMMWTGLQSAAWGATRQLSIIRPCAVDMKWRRGFSGSWIRSLRSRQIQHHGIEAPKGWVQLRVSNRGSTSNLPRPSCLDQIAHNFATPVHSGGLFRAVEATKLPSKLERRRHRLLHPRIADLHKEGPIGPRQCGLVVAKLIVPIAGVEGRLWIHLVSEEELRQQGLRFAVHAIYI